MQQLPDSSSIPADFLQVPGPFGHPVLIHRLQAEQSAASGMPVLIALPADACRLALAGKSLDPREGFTELDGHIASLLDEHGQLTAAELAFRLDDERDHITSTDGVHSRFRDGRPLIVAGYRKCGRKGFAPPL